MISLKQHSKKSFLALLTVLGVFLFSHSAVAYTMHNISGQSLSDKNQYAYITLDNGLTAILISDPTAERSSASLAVKAGSFRDPVKHPGIAHLLEHMLFLGTQKYPEAGAYQTFIRQHGGTHNAYTSSQLTNYYFDVLPEAYPEALDRFAQFFIAPTLDKRYVAREINAVDSEYKAKLGDENRRSNEAIKTLYNPEHPASHFTVGNLDTLGTIPTTQLCDLLQTFKQKYYTPDNMVVTLVANQPINTLAAWANTYFRDIEPRPTAKPLALPVLVQDKGRIQFFKTKTEKSIVKFSFPIPSQTLKYASQPARYLAHVLGDESENSLFADLKNHNWVQSLHAGTSQDDGQHALFSITLRLTDEGIEQRNKVRTKLLKAIQNLKNSPISKQYLQDMKALSGLSFDYHDYVQPIRLSKVLSSRALDVPTDDILRSFHISKLANATDIQTLLGYLRTDNLIIQWQHPSIFPEDWIEESSHWQTEPLYQGKYRNGKLSAIWFDNSDDHSLSSNYGLPKANPYIPSNLALITRTQAAPYTIQNREGFDFWFKENGQYQKPTGMIFGYFGFLDQTSIRDKLLVQLWARLFSDAMSEHTYQPYTAGLGYQLYAHSNGLTLKTSGYSDKQQDFFIDLTKKLMAFRAKPERLEVAKQEILKGLNNLESQPPYALARHYFNQLVIKGNATTSTLQNQLSDIQADEINHFIERHIREFKYTGYMTGNFTEVEANQLSNTLFSELGEYLGPHTYQYVKLRPFAAQHKYVLPFDTRSKDATVLYSLIATDTNDASYTERAYVRILSQLLSSRFYNEFRTEKQYGYIVAVTNQTIEKTPAIGFLIQSPNTAPEKLVKEIEGFLDDHRIWGDNVSDAEFEKARTSVLAAFLQPPTNLREEASEEWPHIVEPEHNFSERQQWIEAINGLTRQSFVEYMNKKIQQKQSARLLVTNQWQDLENWQAVNIQQQQEDNKQYYSLVTDTP